MVKDIPGIFLGQSHGHAEFLLYKCVPKPLRKISKTVGTNRRNFCLVLGHVLMLSTDSPTDKNRGKDYCISDLLMIYYRKRETSAANRCLPDGPIDGLPGLSDKIAVSFGRGRLFLCIVTIAASDGISETERRQHKADYSNESFNRQHQHRPPFL